MYQAIRPLLFGLNAEKAHEITLRCLHYLPASFFPTIPANPVSVLGLHFDHPVGLAAGLDKNGEYIDALSKLGFSFIEVGTVTPKPQAGNPRPRLFRLPKASALINRMGFNNHGVEALIKNIQQADYKGILGINIGKNKETPLTRASEDYLYCLERVYPHASYVTINISSPNTPELRDLQHEGYLSFLLAELVRQQQHLADKHQRWVPLLIKLSPDEEQETLKRMAEIIYHHKIAGIIATNTSCSRQGVEQLPFAQEAGGLSGLPIAHRATQCLRTIKDIVGKEVALIASGGIDSKEIAYQKIQAGADLIQLYTGLIYHGPQLILTIANYLREKDGKAA